MSHMGIASAAVIAGAGSMTMVARLSNEGKPIVFFGRKNRRASPSASRTPSRFCEDPRPRVVKTIEYRSRPTRGCEHAPSASGGGLHLRRPDKRSEVRSQRPEPEKLVLVLRRNSQRPEQAAFNIAHQRSTDRP